MGGFFPTGWLAGVMWMWLLGLVLLFFMLVVLFGTIYFCSCRCLDFSEGVLRNFFVGPGSLFLPWLYFFV